MSERTLPKGWVETTIGEICSGTQYGWTTKATTNGEIKFLRTTDITNLHLDWDSVPFCEKSPVVIEKYLLTENDILISRAGSVGFHITLKKIPHKAVFASYLIRIRPIRKAIDVSYFSFFLRSAQYWNQVNSAASGIALKNLNAEKIKKISLPLPPLAEQKRIADKLDSLLAYLETCRAHLDRVPETLARFRQSVLAAATSGRLTEDWRNENYEILSERNGSTVINEIQEYKKHWVMENAAHNEYSNVKKRVLAYSKIKNRNANVPSSWRVSPLEDACLMIVDCHNKTAPYKENGIPIVRTSNIRDGKFVWDGIRFINQETYSYWARRCPPEAGDIIFTREAPMGEAAIIPEGMKVCLGQRTMLIRPIEELISAKYILYCLMDPIFKQRANSISVGTGVKHYRVGDVSELIIPIPSLPEQAEIIKRVEALFAEADSIEERYKAARVRVDSLEPALLAKAFRGELVAQDTADESASVLLERIKNARAASDAKGGRGLRVKTEGLLVAEAGAGYGFAAEKPGRKRRALEG